ncbi:MAG: Jag N-terminal domain-containing protein [Actinomycetota bacterium]|nr:Jag N-terminal domain-containing protein [Actinomycetota bacterium]
MQEIERSAASVEEAVEAGLEALGVSEQEVVIQIVQEPRAGFLGLRAQEATVRMRLKRIEETQSVEDLEEQADVVVEFLEGLLRRMGIDAGVETNYFEKTMYVDILGSDEEEGDDDMALLIGRHGQTLEAVQEVVRVAVGQRTGERCRVIVDVEDYKKRRRSRLAARAKDLAKRVQRTGREETLEPMNPYERKIVHDAAGSITGISTESSGEEPERRVVIRRTP